MELQKEILLNRKKFNCFYLQATVFFSAYDTTVYSHSVFDILNEITRIYPVFVVAGPVNKL